MNNKRRKELKSIQEKLEQNKNILKTVLEDIKNNIEMLECIKTEEEMALENLPESLLSSDRASYMDDAISELEDALSYKDDIETNTGDVISYLEDIMGNIKTAME